MLSCVERDGQWLIELAATAFYPEGGGQPCDTGVLGGAAVTAVHSVNGAVLHSVSAPLPVGQPVHGELDWARRLDHMEQHTGEHILSGTLHALFGAENVGFHIGEPFIRMDLSLPLTPEQLAEGERQANAVVRADVPVRCWYPGAAELAATPYRSKKELEGAVRLVAVPGADCCACCGTHLAGSGAVGLIKIITAQGYKGGVRLAVACGARAFAAVQSILADAQRAGTLLSAAPGSLAPAMERFAAAQGRDKQRLAALQNALGDALAAAARPGERQILLPEGLDADGARRACLKLAAQAGTLCAVFFESGGKLNYMLSAGEQADARPAAKALNAAFAGRGGGKPNLCQGSLAATAAQFEEIKHFLSEV